MTAAEALTKINNDYHVDILREGSRVCNCVSDLCPGETRVARRIKLAYESGAVKILSDTAEEKFLLFEHACQKLADYSEVSESVAEETVSYFFDALGWPHCAPDDAGVSLANNPDRRAAASFFMTGRAPDSIKGSAPNADEALFGFNVQRPGCINANALKRAGVISSAHQAVSVIEKYKSWGLITAKRH